MEKSVNPAPLGLLGFGMTTILLNIHNAGFYPMSAAILGMGIFYGGIAQIIAGVMESKNGNTFATTAFISYGMFWLSLVALILMPKFGWADEAPAGFMGCFLALWGLFTAGMFVGTFKANRAMQVVFGSLTILFFMLAAHNFLDSEEILKYAGYEGIFCGASAFYLAIAEILNEKFGRHILPVG